MPIIEEPTWWHAPYEHSESWQGPFPTREAAVADAGQWGNEYVAEARRAIYSAADLIGVHDDLIGAWCDSNEEMVGEDGETPFDHWPMALRQSLNKHLRMAAAEWAAAVGVNPKAAWMFHDMSPAEYIFAREHPHDR